MKTLQRLSPITFKTDPLRAETRDNWEVALEYSEEGDGPWIIDLSHLRKWNVQGENLSDLSPGGLSMPEASLDGILESKRLITRVKSNWATIWRLSGEKDNSFDDFAGTDVTESYAMLAIVGRQAFAIMEKVSNLDLTDPARKPPFLMMGPVMHVRTHTVVVSRDSRHSVVIIAVDRGYGQCMAEALLDAGEEWDLRPAGEEVFTRLI